MIDLSIIIKLFEEHSPFLLSLSTIALVAITFYYAIQTRSLTRNQLRPAFSHSLVGFAQNGGDPANIHLCLRNIGMAVAFNIQVEYSIKGTKHTDEQRKRILVIQADRKTTFSLSKMASDCASIWRRIEL